MPGFSATQVLHKFPATYIGSAVAGKLHSIDDVIQKVLVDKRPTLSKELYVCLSMAEVKLVEVKGDQEEVVCMSHETSRIRAIGVYSQDKRFMGYIIKEEGKPLTTYVLRCNSAALMVSLMSFLRQSCQLTSFQRGGSFYDELAADDADDCDYIIDVSKLRKSRVVPPPLLFPFYLYKPSDFLNHQFMSVVTNPCWRVMFASSLNKIIMFIFASLLIQGKWFGLI